LPFATQLFVFLAAAAVAVPLASRLGFGSVLGFLIAGVVIGPHGLRLAFDTAGEVRHAAELGVVLLLFLIGLELEPRRLLELRVPVFGLGSIQVVATALAIAGGALLLGAGWRTALVAGLGLSLSSTALVVQLLSERGEMAAPHGQTAFGILLFQDLAVIPMLALLPALGGGRAGGGEPLWLVGGRALLVIAAVVLASRFVARPALRFVAGLRSPDLFTIAALLLVVATALLVSSAGLSEALGAFLAGILLASSEFRHELEADISPFKGLLLGLFFMAVGMGADVRILGERPAQILGLVAGLVAVKGLVAFAIGRAYHRASDPAATLAVALSQGGEFAFVLFGLAGGLNAMDRATVDALVVAVTLSMATTPPLLALHARVVRPRLRAGPPRAYDVAPDGEPPVIIAGFGRVGQVVGRVLRARRIPFTAMDVSAEQIDFIRKFGNKVFYGDASRLDLLRAARADRARVFVLAIDDVEASMRTAEVVREHFPHLAIVARARNRAHAYRLRNLGLTRIMRETLLSSLEMTSDVLQALGFDQADAIASVQRFRAHDEQMLEASWRHAADFDKLRAIAEQGRRELEDLFEKDADTRRSA
jgi:glutathione-regulated potassium-efflux system protein KefB